MKQSNREENKPKRRFSEEQYQMLLRCSEEEKTKKEKDEKGLWCNKWQYKLLKVCATDDEGIEKWNEWREGHPDKEIWLEGAKLGHAHLENADLFEAHLENANLFDAHLENADLRGAHLENANLWATHLENADLFDAHLENANLFNAHLENANLVGAYLEHADLECAHLENADLGFVHLEHAKLTATHLENAMLFEAHLEHADLFAARLKNAVFSMAIVDGATLICRCEVNHKTNFSGVGLGSCRIDPGTKQLLEYNIRRMNWEEWYKEHWFWRWPVQLFWGMSDYGRSTLRVVGVFFLLAFLFAGIYVNCAYWRPPGIIDNLIVEPAIEQEMSVVYYFWLALVRPIYFSIVTQTTLGFGDMYANKGSVAGHVILGVQVIFGYVLLGALITRFAVLFTAGGPAGKFEE